MGFRSVTICTLSPGAGLQYWNTTVKHLCSGCLNTDMGFGSGDAQWHSLQGGSSTDSNSKPNAKEHDITRMYFEYLKMQCAVMYSIYKV